MPLRSLRWSDVESKRSLAGLVLLIALAASVARADVPYPTCADAGCADPSDFGAYLFLAPDQLPDDFDPLAGSSWKYNPGTGMSIPGAWRITTGRPDVVVAVLDSGIRWGQRDLVRKIALNTGELPPPAGCALHDCNGDGFVNVDDYPDVPDHNGNGLVDGQDLIREFSDGVDDDANGYLDDIAGWDFDENDNDPDDDVDYGHGTGQAEDSTGEANNGGGLPGVAPSALFLPLKVADSFVGVGSDFAQAVVYATDRRVGVIQEALGVVSASASSQAAIDYAYRHGIPVIASAADESSRHHNFPAVLDHTIWMNSIVHGDGTLVEQTDVYDLMNGCTNYGGRAWVAISSNSCSSEATGRGAGLATLLVSHGKNLLDAGKLSPHPRTGTPLSAEEVRQLFRRSAEDVDHEANLTDLTMDFLLQLFLSAPALDLPFESQRFPTQEGWDAFTGYGRPDATQLLDLAQETIPPEADLSGNLRWFDSVDPLRTPQLPVEGSAAAARSPGGFEWLLEVGCGVQPKSWDEVGRGRSQRRLDRAVLGHWTPGETAATCGFDPAGPLSDPDDHTVTLRLQVRDGPGNLGEDRRTVAIHTDPLLRFPPIALGASAEGSSTLVDVNRDGVLDVVIGTAGGAVHAYRGDTGAELPGFPAWTDPIPVHASPAYARGEVPVPHEALIASTAADDLDGDGRIEIVAASVEGRLYVFDDHGQRRPGFPVTTNPAFSEPAHRDRLNDTNPGMVGAPTLVDLDAPGVHPDLELVVAALDGHLYAFRADASPVPGFPVRIADRAEVSIDAATGVATALSDDVRERGAKLIGSPAVGDLNGDGRPELLVTSNEEYAGEENGFALETFMLNLAAQLADQFGEFSFDTGGRLYAVHPDGNLAAGGPFLPGWPVNVPLIAPGLLPTVGTGTPGSPALADLDGPDGSGELAVAIFSTAGPAMLFDAFGEPALGTLGGVPRSFAADFPLGFPAVPDSAGSPDAPFFAALGSGAFGDLTGDGLPEYVAPTAGLRQLLEVGAAAHQTFSDHQISAFDPRDGSLLPAFPRVMDDLQFLSNPSLGDVDGDGVAEILQGSGVYLLHAYRADGSEPAGFPKFTHGWMIGSPTAGDVDGDGLVELVVATREGRLYVWDTPGVATEAALPWQGFGGDRRNTQNLESPVSSLAGPVDPVAGLLWTVEALVLEVEERLQEAGSHSRRRLEAASHALDRLAEALEQHMDSPSRNPWRLLRALPAAERSLAAKGKWTETADLHALLLEAARTSAGRALAEADCNESDRLCRSRLALAERLFRIATAQHTRGASRSALVLWSRVLSMAPPSI